MDHQLTESDRHLLQLCAAVEGALRYTVQGRKLQGMALVAHNTILTERGECVAEHLWDRERKDNGLRSIRPRSAGQD